MSFANYQALVMRYMEKRPEEERNRAHFRLRVPHEQDVDFARGTRTNRAERFALVKSEKGWRVKLP